MDNMLLFINCGHYLSRSAIVAELAEIDSLPGSQIELSICDRDGKADSE